ncbi:MAG TPA: head GIN domain-containing protein [Sphingomicrobium sp.]|nr:head GIN domain-containing protein [Sphingomicrobium sp.]
MIKSFASVAVAALLAGGCNFSSDAKERDAGPQASRTYQVGAFDKIAVSGPYDVNVVTGAQGGVSAKGGSNLLDETDVVVEDGTLKIRPKKHKGIRWSWKGGKASFTVNAAALQGAAIAGSGGIAIDKVAGDFEGDVAGSGDLKVGAANGGKFKLAIAGSGDIEAAGKVDSVDLAIAGSGDIRAGGLAARTADVSIAGSGNIAANASESADVSIMGSGDVEVTGGAKCKVSKAGSGNVRCG